MVGEPDSGKTTLLRQIARELAAQKRAVAVIDERGELFRRSGRMAMPLTASAACPKAVRSRWRCGRWPRR